MAAKDLDLTEFGGEPPELDLSEFDQAPAAPSSMRRIADVGISALKGVIAVPEAAVGMADLVTGGQAGKKAEELGFRPKEAKAMLDELYSPQQKAANQALAEAKGFIPSVQAALQNPSTIGHAVVESLPLLAPGALVGRAVQAATKAAPWVAGAVGEGAVGMGSAAEAIRQESPDGLMTGDQALAGAGSGLGTALFGAAGNKLAKTLNIGDADTAFLNKVPGQAADAPPKGVLRRIGEGALAEGVFEELPQSMQEQAWQNYATGKPLGEGVAEAGAIGMLAGAVMGGAFGAAGRQPDAPATKTGDTPKGAEQTPAASPPPAPPPVSGPLTAALNTGNQAQAPASPPFAGTRKVIADEAQRQGVDPVTALLVSAIGTEGAFDPGTASGKTSGHGLFQFLDAHRKAHPEISPAQWQDPAVQARLGVQYIKGTNDNMRLLLGAEPTPGQAYLGHLLGAYGAGTVLKADPDMPIELAIAGYDPKRAPRIVSQNDLTGLTVAETVAKFDTLAQDHAQRLALEAKAFPFRDKKLAERRAQAMQANTGTPHEVVDHPAVAGSFAVLPTPSKPLPKAKPAEVAPVQTAQDLLDPADNPEAGVSRETLNNTAPAGNAVNASITEGESTTSAPPVIASPVDAGAHQAASSPLNDRPPPSTAQVLGDSAKLGHARIGPLDVSFETSDGAFREDKNNDPPQWRTQMQGYHYGRIKRTEAADSTPDKKQQVDVFVKAGLSEKYDGPVYVVDQIDPKTARFDEHKALVGPASEQEARADYLRHYEAGWQGLGAVTTFPSVREFDAWVKAGKKAEALAYKAPGMVEQIDQDTGEITMVPAAPVAQPNAGGATPSPQPPTAAAAPVAAPVEAPGATPAPAPEVSRFNGQHGHGMGMFAARQEAARLNKLGDGITYTAEEHDDPKLEHPWAVVGRKPAAAPAAPAPAAAPARGKPRLGETANDVYAAFKKAVGEGVVAPGKGIVPVVARVVGMPGGDFRLSLDGKKLERVSHDGMTVRDATASEQAEFHDALEKDQVQVLARSRWGNGQASKDLQELHSPSGNSYAKAPWSAPLTDRYDSPPAATGRSEQFNNYRQWLDKNPGPIPAGMREEIQRDERLNDGEAEVLLAAQSPAAGPKRGTVGMKLASGETVTTATGRTTTPFPKVHLNTNIGVARAVKLGEQWLMQNAVDEAKARGDNFAMSQFLAAKDKPQQADKDSAEEYLFGEPAKKAEPAKTSRLLPPPSASYLKKHGQQVASSFEALRRWSDGERIFLFHDGGGTKFVEAENMEMLAAYTADQMLALPQVDPEDRNLDDAEDAAEPPPPVNQDAVANPDKYGFKGELPKLRIVDRAIKHLGSAEAFVRAVTVHFRELAADGYPVLPADRNAEIEGVADEILASETADGRPAAYWDHPEFDPLPALEGTSDFPRLTPVFKDPGETLAMERKLKDAPLLTPAEASAKVEAWKAVAQRIGREQDNSNKVVISLFDRTGVFSQPFVDAGYTVFRYDLDMGTDLMKEFPIHDILMLQQAGKEIVGVIAQPPCTSFAVSGAHSWAAQHDRPSRKMVEKKYGAWAAEYFDSPLEVAQTLAHTAELVMELTNPTQFYVLENPVGRIAKIAGLPQPTMTLQPHHFGNPYTKKTLLWGKFNTAMPTANVSPKEEDGGQGSKIAKLRGTNPVQKLERSVTPDGMAYAFFMANHPGAMAMLDQPASVAAPAPAPAKPLPTPEQVATVAADKAADKAAKPQPDKDRATAREVERDLYGALVKNPDMVGKSLDDVRAALEARLGAMAGNADLTHARAIAATAPRLNILARAVHKQIAANQRELEKQKHRVPEVRNQALLAAINEWGSKGGQPGNTATVERFIAGFDHFLKGKTKSTLVGDQLADQQRGYEAAQKWAKTEEGAAWYEGRPVNKLVNTGVDLRRHWEALAAQMKANESDTIKAWKQIEQATARADLFAPLLPDGVSPGFRLYVEHVRSNLRPFKDWLENKHVNWYGSMAYRSKHHKPDKSDLDYILEGKRYPGKFTPDERAKWAEDAGFRAQWLRDAANEWLENARGVIGFLDGKTSVREAAEAFETLYVNKAKLAELIEQSKTKERWLDWDHALNEAGRKVVGSYGKSYLWSGSTSEFTQLRLASSWTEHLIEKEATIALPTKNAQLVPPKLDRVRREGLTDQRKGKSVTPAEFKATFGFADVGFGKWVGSKQDQDHLNYAYDAFMDLANHFGMDPKNIGFGGQLHFTIGALGHGKAAAHFWASQPHPDGGTVSVINLTNTKGDGTVYHEWIHALDHFLGGQWRSHVRPKLLKVLTRAPDTAEEIDAIARRFLIGGAFWTNNKKMSKVDAALRGLEYYASGQNTTAYKINADKLGKDYWGNENELIARAAEAWAVDTLSGTNTYLVNPAWAGDGAATPEKGYRGTPYPTGSERERFAKAYTWLAKAVTWDNGKPSVTLKDFNANVDQAVLDPGADRRAALSVRETMEAYYLELQERVGQQKAREASAKAERERAEREALEKLAAEKIAELAPVVDAPTPAETMGDLDEADLSDLFDQAAAELREERQEQPDVPAPGVAPAAAPVSDGPTATDADYLIKQIERGRMVLFSGTQWARDKGLPTIHSMQEFERRGEARVTMMGYGVFKFEGDDFSGTFTGGGAMDKAPEGTSYTTFDVSKGRWEYPKARVIDALRTAARNSLGELTQTERDKLASGRYTPADIAMDRQAEKLPNEVLDAFKGKGRKVVDEQDGSPQQLSEDAAWWAGLSPEQRKQAVAAAGMGPEAATMQNWDAFTDSARAALRRPDKTASQLIAQAAKLGVKGVDEALKGLSALFGKPGLTRSFPGGMDEETYQQAKPHFQAALAAFQAAGKSLKDLFKLLIDQFGDSVKPYAVRFAKEQHLTAQLGSKPSASVGLATWVKGQLNRPGAPHQAMMSWQALFERADAEFGGTQAEGKYTPKDAYDAMEAGVNLHLMEQAATFDPRLDAARAVLALAQLDRMMVRLPTQTKRTAEQDEFQQFSTVPALAYAANWVANLSSADTVLEPSAGIGGLAVFARNAGARLILNELSSRRAAVLQEVFPATKVWKENAEQLHNILPESLVPSAVVMNPPFSASAGRLQGARDTKLAGQHIEQALARLAPGGRLVAIVGEGMAMDRPAFKAWWAKIGAQYDVRAAVPMDGAGYAKYGTTFDNVLLVIDKVAPSGRATVTAKADNYQQLIGLLAGIRNDRPAAQLPADERSGLEQDAAESARSEPVPAGQGEAGGAATGAGGTGAVGGGQPDGRGAALAGANSGGAGGGGNVRPGGAGQPPAGSDGNRGRGDAAGGGDAAAGAPRGLDAPSALKPGENTDLAAGALTDSVFESYTPQRLQVEGARAHPGALVQSSAMASVLPPKVAYTPNLPAKTIKGFALDAAKPKIIDGGLSLAQLESVVYAGQAHGELLEKTPEGEQYRRGFFIGDGTGVGKGREIGAILLDNLRQGRKKHVWVSEKQPLMTDAKRDFAGVGGDPGLVFNQNKTKAKEKIEAKDGILYTTYSTLRAGTQTQGVNKPLTKKALEKLYPPFTSAVVVDHNDNRHDAEILGDWDPKKRSVRVKLVKSGREGSIGFNALVEVDLNKEWQRGAPKAKDTEVKQSRLDQLVQWLGKDFDGVIAFDEAHNAGNAVPMKAERGESKPAAQALAVVELQKKLPKARVVYVSATGATQVSNLSFATRLGLWGPGTPFPTVQNFIAEMTAGGLATMELVARDLKQMGGYIARSLSFDGVTYSRVEHELTTDQRAIYDRLAEAWQVTLQHFNAALEVTGGKKDKDAKKNAKSAYWSAQQRFFNQIITSMQMPTAIESIERDLAAGDAVTLQLVNTNEAQQNRAIAKRREEDDDPDLEELDLTPRDQLLTMVEKAFPVQQYEEYTDADGKKATRLVMDAQGNIVQNREAVAMRDKLLQDLKDIRVPNGPLEQVLNYFGVDNVSEVTGRTQRVVQKPDPKTGEPKATLESRGPASARADADAFMADKKRILVFSDAGGTGFSFHADLTKKNQRKRKHYLLQPGWRADKAVQGFGRTHRTNQKSAPHYYLASTNIPAQKRFLSAIARRLDQLGALTKGQRDAASQGMFSEKDNLESKYASQAVVQLVNDLKDNRVGGIPGLTFQEFLKQTGLEDIVNPETGNIANDKYPTTQQFLNRMLSLKLDMQELVFDAFVKRMEEKVQIAAQRGELETGMQTIRALKSEVVSDEVIYNDPRTGAQTRYVELTLTQATELYDFPRPGLAFGTKLEYLRQTKTGRVYVRTKSHSTATLKDGTVVDRFWLQGTNGANLREAPHFQKTAYEPIKEAEARELWDKENAAKPPTYTQTAHMIVGAMLPIWDRLQTKSGTLRVARTQTVDGKRLLGRVIQAGDVSDIRKRLNLESAAAKMTPAQAMAAILKGQVGELANGWKLLRARVSNDLRIELQAGHLSGAAERELLSMGVVHERISWSTRYFVPTGPAGVPVLEALFKTKPLVDLVDPKAKEQDEGDEERDVFSRSVAKPVTPRLADTVIADEVEKRIGQFAQQPPVLIRDSALGVLPGVTGDDNVAGAVHQGAIYLFADQLADRAAVQRTLFHELLHYGLRKFLTREQFTAHMLRLYARDAALAAEADRWAATPEGQRAAAQGGAEYARARGVDEALAVLAEPNGGVYLNQSARAMFVRRVTRWLAHLAEALGFDRAAAWLRGTTNEEAREYIQGIFRRLQRDTGAPGNGDAFTDVAFSQATGKRMGAAIKAVTVADVKQRAGGTLAHYRTIMLQWLGGRHLTDVYERDLPPLPGYTHMVQQMTAEANNTGAEADALARRWADVKDERALAELMHEATMEQIDPTKEFVAGDNLTTWIRLSNAFKALSPEAQQLFKDARDSYEAHYAQVKEAIRDKIMRSALEGKSKAKLIARMEGEFFGKVKGIYFPLARFGKYVVVVREADGEVAAVSRAETPNEAEELRKKLAVAYPERFGFTVGKVLKDKEYNAARDSVGRGFLKELFAVLEDKGVDDVLRDAINQLYLNSVPDLSWAKHGIHRKGTAGFSQDARRAFAQNMFHGARYLSKLRYADQLQDKLNDMQDWVDSKSEDKAYDSIRAQQVVDELVKRHDSLMNPNGHPLSTALTSVGFVFHLGLSPASAMVNVSQTALVAYPLMAAKWGYGKTASALSLAMKQAGEHMNDISKALSGDELEAYHKAVQAGTIDVTMAHDLAGIAQGEDQNAVWALRPAMRWASFLFHHAERFNRQVTFMAAYRLAKDAGATAEQAFEQATKTTYDGHFDYAASNRPRIMQGNVAKVLLLFKQYAQNMVYTMVRLAHQSFQAETPEGKREARKALGGLLTAHALAAGVLGLPVVNTLLWAASQMGGDDDEPWDAEVALRNMLADAIGQKPAEVMTRGLSRLTPWDISGRVGLDRLIFPDVQEGLEGARFAESAMGAALGPVAGIAITVAKGVHQIAEGHLLQGLESMLPSVLRGLVRSLRYATEGAKDRTGIVIKDEVGAAGIAGQALGFSPSEVRLATEGRSAIYQHNQRLMERRRELMNQYAQAAMKKDAEAVAQAGKAIVAFNQKNPTRVIAGLHLQQSIRARQRRISQADQGVYLPRKQRESLQEGRFAIEN